MRASLLLATGSKHPPRRHGHHAAPARRQRVRNSGALANTRGLVLREPRRARARALRRPARRPAPEGRHDLPARARTAVRRGARDARVGRGRARPSGAHERPRAAAPLSHRPAADSGRACQHAGGHHATRQVRPARARRATAARGAGCGRRELMSDDPSPPQARQGLRRSSPGRVPPGTRAPWRRSRRPRLCPGGTFLVRRPPAPGKRSRGPTPGPEAARAWRARPAASPACPFVRPRAARATGPAPSTAQGWAEATSSARI